MKAVMITYAQAHHEAIVTILDRLNCRGYTCLPQVTGRGQGTGDPHLGTHAWPALNGAIIAVTTDDKAHSLLERLRQLDAQSPLLGLRAWSWEISESL